MAVKKRKTTIQVIHGPNLNLLGTRETDIYGAADLNTINRALQLNAEKNGVSLCSFQSNHEGEILDHIHQNRDSDGFLINPAALTHTSVALRDALSAVNKPVVEIHLSNVFKREEFRHRSFISGIAIGVICGFGEQSYLLGLKALINHLHSKQRGGQ